MAEFYSWSMTGRWMVTVLLASCVLLQTVAVVLSSYRYPRSRTRIFENLLEMAVLFQIIICSLLFGQAALSFEIGVIAPTGYVVLRYIAFTATTLLAGIVAALDKKLWPLLLIVASGSMLPAVEAFSQNTFAWLCLGAMLFLQLRSIHICILRTREIKTSISALSIKTAIDSLRSGVLFGEADGFILLSNTQMQRLMVATTGKVRRNGEYFYDLLATGELEPNCHRTEFEGQIVCLLPDETAWIFNKTKLRIKHKVYVQLTAADITQRWKLTEQLQRQEELLRLRSSELHQAIANIHTLSHQREVQKSKMRAHDILGQRLTLLLRTLRNQQMMSSTTLQELAKGLLEDLKAQSDILTPQDEFDSLQHAFASIGVEIGFVGNLPCESERGRLVVEIIRESVTNAVRHGFATTVSIVGEEASDGYHLEISNNGHPPSEPIVEGGGIGGMRQKVKPHGGSVNVTARPHFMLEVILPGGEAND